MNRATGIHLSSRTMRLVTLDGSPSNCRLCALVQAPLPVPFVPETLLDEQARQRLAGGIAKAIGSDRDARGRTTASLGGGLFQIQKIPLEVAAEEDRRNQVAWEVSQALISPAEDYIVDCHPAGRAAFWVAVRRTVAELCTRLYELASIPVDGFEVDPIALFRACTMARHEDSGRNGAILLGSPWLSFVAVDGDDLVAAETVRADSCAVTPSQAGTDADAQDRQATLDLVRRWVYGDLSSDRRRMTYQHVSLCGDQDDIHDLIHSLQASVPPNLTPLQPFSDCDTNHLPEAQRALLSDQSAFGVAAGLAYHGLRSEAISAA